MGNGNVCNTSKFVLSSKGLLVPAVNRDRGSSRIELVSRTNMHETGNNHSLIFVFQKDQFILPLFSNYNAPKPFCRWMYPVHQSREEAINQVVLVQAHCVVHEHNRDNLNHLLVRQQNPAHFMRGETKVI